MISKAIKSFSSIPGPKGLPVVGNLLNYTKLGEYSKDTVSDAYVDYRRKYGDIFKEDLGNVSFVHVTNPHEITKVMQNESKYPKRVLFPIYQALRKFDKCELGLLGNGEEWWKVRQPIQKTMVHPAAASAYLKTQIKVADDFIAYIKDKSAKGVDGVLPDTLEDITNYAMESIGTVAFGIRLGALNDNPSEEKKRFVILMKRYFEMVAKSCFMVPLFLHFKTPFYKEFSRVKKEIDDISRNFLKTKETVKDYNKDVNIIASLSQVDWTESEKINLAITLLQAGVESTAHTLCFLLYNLSKNPHVQDKLYDEINSVIGDNEIEFNHLNDLEYMKACLKESFRIYFPILAGTNRIIEKDMKIKDYEIPSGTCVVINCESITKSGKYFDDSSEFRPERWLKCPINHENEGEQSKKMYKRIPKACLLPFGYGKRMCIGRRFAEQEIYLATIKILKNFQIRENGKEILGTKTSTFKKPDRKVNFQFKPRNF